MISARREKLLSLMSYQSVFDQSDVDQDIVVYTILIKYVDRSLASLICERNENLRHGVVFYKNKLKN